MHRPPLRKNLQIYPKFFILKRDNHKFIITQHILKTFLNKIVKTTLIQNTLFKINYKK